MLALVNLGAGRSRPAQKDRVEYRARQREAAIAEGAKAVRRRELPANPRAIRRPDHHSGEMRGAGGFTLLERAHGRQNPGCLRTEIFPARLLAWKVGPLEHHHARTLAREVPRRRASCRAGAHDQHVNVVHENERLSRWNTPM